MLRIFLVLHLLATWTTAYITLPVNPLTPTTDYDGFDTTAAFVLDQNTEDDYFGSSVAMTDNWAIVGAPRAKKAFIFKNTAGIWDTTAAFVLDQNTADDGFGGAVAMTDQWAIVFSDAHPFIFKNTDGNWDTTAISLTANTTTSSAVAMTDNWAIMEGQDALTKKALIFKNTAGSWDTNAAFVLDYTWTEHASARHSVAMTDNWAIVTAFEPGDIVYTGNKAFIFKNTGGTWGTTPVATLNQNQGEGTFGWKVAMTDNWAIVTAHHTKKAFIFKNTNGNWGTTAAFVLDQNTADDDFGSSVAMTDSRAIIGANQKSFIFKNTDGNWDTTAAFVLDQNTGAINFFGVATTDNWAIMGSYSSDKAFMFWLPENSCPKYSSKLSADGSECVDCESRKYAWLGHHTECIDCEKARTLITMNQGGVYRNSKSSRARFIQAFAQDGACGNTLMQATCTQLKNEYQTNDKCEC